MTAVRPTTRLSRGRVGSIALWLVQILLAITFIASGIAKLAGAPVMVAVFNAIGVGQWFRYLTGLIESVGAVALLTPSLAPFGAVVLAATMVGAIAAHLFVIGGSPTGPIVLLLLSLTVTWVRRDQLISVVSRWG